MPSRAQSVTATYVAWDTVANLPKTGDVANHTLRWVKDGTSSAPTNSPSEVDSTNAKGVYKLTLTSAEATCDVGTLAGVSSTANVVIVPLTITFEQLPTAAPTAANGLITRGTGTGQLNVFGGSAAASVAVDGLGAASIASGAYDAIADRVLDYALTNGAAGGLGAILLSLDARLPAALVSGRIDAYVGAMGANVLTAAALATDAASEVAAATVAAMDSTSTALASLISGQSSLASGQTTINTNVLAVGTTATTILGQTGTSGVKLAASQTFNNTGTWTGNLTGSVGSVAAPVTVGTNNDKTGYTLGSFGFTVTVGANNDKSGYKLAADGVDAIAVESGINLRQAVALILSVAVGLVSKLAGVFTFKAAGATSAGATRVTANAADGSRTSVTLNPPA